MDPEKKRQALEGLAMALCDLDCGGGCSCWEDGEFSCPRMIAYAEAAHEMHKAASNLADVKRDELRKDMVRRLGGGDN